MSITTDETVKKNVKAKLSQIEELTKGINKEVNDALTKKKIDGKIRYEIGTNLSNIDRTVNTIKSLLDVGLE